MVFAADITAAVNPSYDDKKKNALRDRDIPHDHIVWVLCGQPGVHLDSINATIQAADSIILPKGSAGRRAARGGEENNHGDENSDGAKKLSEIQKLNRIKLREVTVQENVNRRNELKSSLEALKESKQTEEVDSTQWKIYHNQYLEVLEELASGVERKALDDDTTRRLQFNSRDGTPRAEFE